MRLHVSTFNSLFEMRATAGAVQVMNYAPFNSLFEMHRRAAPPLVATGAALSILYLRCVLRRYGKRRNARIRPFQFSI